MGAVVPNRIRRLSRLEDSPVLPDGVAIAIGATVPFSLILSVGILVDSAIVVTEAIHTKMKGMQEKDDAAINTIKEFHYPLRSQQSKMICCM